VATPRQAIVLSGGGANGAYEVGVMKALLQGDSPATGHVPLSPDIFAATSIGAFNASVLMSAGMRGWREAIDYLERVWTDVIPGSCHNRIFRFRGDLVEFFDLNCITTSPSEPLRHLANDALFFARDWFTRGLNLVTSGGEAQQRLLELVDLSTLISGVPAMHLVQQLVSFEELQRSVCPLRIIATEWRTGDVRIFTNEELTREIGPLIVLASAAVPGIFPPVYIGSHVYVDGGVVMNTPLSPAIDAGADVLHTIYMDPDLSVVPVRALRNTLDTISRMTMIQFAATMNRDIEVAAMINRGLAEEGQPGSSHASDRDAKSRYLLAGHGARTARQREGYRQLTIHRFHPTDDLSGPAGILDFGQARVCQLIARGHRDAAEHDCVQSGCLLPSTATSDRVRADAPATGATGSGASRANLPV
jgi:predicted acylesterase/phospholipase RssA